VDANASINASFIISGFYIISGCYKSLLDGRKEDEVQLNVIFMLPEKILGELTVAVLSVLLSFHPGSHLLNLSSEIDVVDNKYSLTIQVTSP
jgi:hypothetical protein